MIGHWEPEFEIMLPATSANLGAAFDAAAIALSLHLRVKAAVANSFHVEAQGRDSELCARLERNLILDTYREVSQQHAGSVIPLSLRIENEIPLGKGLGSSASARLAGISLANHFAELNWNDDRILEEAVRRERHGDNVAACWLGGFVIVRSADRHGPRNFQAHKLAAHPQWPLLIAIPRDPLSTEQARAVLPQMYSRADAVANVQHAMLLAAAFSEGSPDLMREALHDRIHEPYRAALCPLLEPLRSLAASPGVLGAVLSGAGPSVLVVLDPRQSADSTCADIASFLELRGLRAQLLRTTMDDRGAATQRKAIPRFVKN